MKFGVMLNHEYPKDVDVAARIDELVRTTETARDLGFSSIFGLQHYLSSLATLQPLPVLSRLVAHSGDMMLGTGIYIATLEHPVQLAENFATLDQMSGGRVILGCGAGYRRNEFNAFGVERATRWSRLAETIELVRLLWAGGPVSYRGRHFTVEGESISLVPRRRPMPPIWIGANAENTIRRAAAIGADTWLAPPNVKIRWAKGHLGIFQEALAERGTDPAGREYPIVRELYLAETDAAAVAEVDHYIRREYAEYSEYGIEYWKTMYSDLQRKAFLFGSPDTVAAQIADLAEAGFDHFIFRISWSAMPVEMGLRTLRLFADEVIPRFQEVSV